MRFEVARDVAAPRAEVWRLLTTWERQPDWMLDAVAVEVVTPERVGAGVVVRCPTRILGMVVDDVMRVTAWREPAVLEVVHLGRVIRGTGAFELVDIDAGRTRVVWQEEVEPPLGALGAWGAQWLVRPVLIRVFARSLARFAALVEAEAGADRKAS